MPIIRNCGSLRIHVLKLDKCNNFGESTSEPMKDAQVIQGYLFDYRWALFSVFGKCCSVMMKVWL